MATMQLAKHSKAHDPCVVVDWRDRVQHAVAVTGRSREMCMPEVHGIFLSDLNENAVSITIRQVLTV